MKYYFTIHHLSSNYQTETDETECQTEQEGKEAFMKMCDHIASLGMLDSIMITTRHYGEAKIIRIPHKILTESVITLNYIECNQ